MVTQVSWWLFIGLGPAIYWLLPLKARAVSLAAASFVFLAFYAPGAVAVMAALSLASFAAFERPGWFGGLAGRVARSPWPILAVLAYLFWSKYVPAFAAAMGGSGHVLGPEQIGQHGQDRPWGAGDAPREAAKPAGPFESREARQRQRRHDGDRPGRVERQKYE